MIELPRGRGCRLTNEEAQALVDLLRRNFLYQRVQGVRDSGEPPKVLVQIFLNDWNAMLRLLHKAGGWDLTREQKAQVARQVEELKRARTQKAEASKVEVTQPGAVAAVGQGRQERNGL